MRDRPETDSDGESPEAGPSSTAGPPPYRKLRRNEYAPSIRRPPRQRAGGADEGEACSCTPESGCGEGCLNRAVLTECLRGQCGAGAACTNQVFQRRSNAAVALRATPGRGWGLMLTAPLPAQAFVCEYIGEVVSGKESVRRAEVYARANEPHMYMMSLGPDAVIDATRAGGQARFINHSCEPNCETQKWQVGAETRVGIFTRQALPAGEELTYDYGLEFFGGEPVACRCGAAGCAGFLGARSRDFTARVEEWRAGAGRTDVDWEEDTWDGEAYAVAKINARAYDSGSGSGSSDGGDSDGGGGGKGGREPPKRPSGQRKPAAAPAAAAVAPKKNRKRRATGGGERKSRSGKRRAKAASTAVAPRPPGPAAAAPRVGSPPAGPRESRSRSRSPGRSARSGSDTPPRQRAISPLRESFDAAAAAAEHGPDFFAVRCADLAAAFDGALAIVLAARGPYAARAAV